MSDQKIEESLEENTDLEQVKQQAEEYLNCWKRATADYQNFKKAMEKNQLEFVKYANLALMAELLPILNNFKAAFNCIPEDQKENDWIKGIECIKKQFEDLMKNLGIEEIKTIGEKLDPQQHEAVGKEKSEQEEDTIIKEVQPGYRLHDKVIAPAKVIVSG
ncbi:MAG: nucleotide exchange factor GrpE [bacterium]